MGMKPYFKVLFEIVESIIHVIHPDFSADTVHLKFTFSTVHLSATLAEFAAFVANSLSIPHTNKLITLL